MAIETRHKGWAWSQQPVDQSASAFQGGSMKKNIAIRFALAVLLAAGGLQIAQATPAWEFTNPGTSFNNNYWVFGQAFAVNTNVTASGLGYYADPKTGLANGQSIALYLCANPTCETTGTLLATATVTNIYPLYGHFRYVTIPSVSLLAGQSYEVVGTSNTANYTWSDPGFAVNPAVSLVTTYNGGTDRWVAGNSPIFLGDGNYTSDLGGEDGYWGPDVFLGLPSFTTVPEPTSLAMFGLGLSLLGLLLYGRRRSMES